MSCEARLIMSNGCPISGAVVSLQRRSHTRSPRGGRSLIRRLRTASSCVSFGEGQDGCHVPDKCGASPRSRPTRTVRLRISMPLSTLAYSQPRPPTEGYLQWRPIRTRPCDDRISRPWIAATDTSSSPTAMPAPWMPLPRASTPRLAPGAAESGPVMAGFRALPSSVKNVIREIGI
jgi:hypothetical protein